jgi:putative phosphoesterase
MGGSVGDMKVIVISDTHIPVAGDKLPDGLIKELKGADFILHAGDLLELSVLDELKKFAPCEAVSGNMDYPQVRRVLPEKKVLEIGGFKIGLIHGQGAPQTLVDFVQDKFADEKLDCIIYGHAHKPSIVTKGGIIYFNPGSPTDHIYAPYNSFGILQITDKLTPSIIRL